MVHPLNFGDRLKEERSRFGLTQQEFADLTNVSKTTQFNYEKGIRSPDAEYLAILPAIGVDVLYILTGTRTIKPIADLTRTEEVVLDNYRSLPEGDQAAVRRLTDALTKSNIYDSLNIKNKAG